MAEARQRTGLLEHLPVFGRGVARARERREIENKLLRDSVAAREEFTDLLGRTVEVPRQAPPPQAFQLYQDPARQQLPMSPIAGPGGFDTVPAVQTPEGQQQVLQLLSRMSPEGAMAAAESIMPGVSKRTTAAMNEMQWLGMEPTIENFQRYHEMRGGPPDPLTTLIAAQQLEATRLANEQRAREAAEAAETKRVETAQREASLNATLRNVGDLAAGNEFLSNTILRTGWGAEQRKTGVSFVEFVKRITGGDSSQEQLLLQTYGDFEKGTANLLNDLLPQLKGINANTDNRLAQIQKSLAAIGNEPGTNAKILSEVIYDVLDIATIGGFNVPQIETWRGLASNLRQFNLTGKQFQTRTVTAPNGDLIHNVPATMRDEDAIQRWRMRTGN